MRHFRFIPFFLALLAVLVLAAPVGAQQLRNRVAPICTDVTGTADAQEQGFIPCSWLQSGSSAGQATWVQNSLGIPLFIQIKDWDSNLQLDVERLSAIMAGLPTTARGAVTVSTLWGRLNNTTWSPLRLDANYRLLVNVPQDAAGNVRTAIYDTDGGGPWELNNVSGTGQIDIREVGGVTVAVTNPLPMRLSVDGANWMSATNPVPISDDAAANTLANTIKMELSDGTNAFLDNTASPGYVRNQDGDSTVLQDVVDTAAHNLALTLNMGWTGAVMYGYDGATLDMLLVGASGELQVTDVATRPGEDAANDWRKIQKTSVAVNTPAVEQSGANAIVTATITCYASREVLDEVNFCVYVENTDGADPIVDVDLEVSPDESTWIDLGWSACDNLAAGGACVYCVENNAYRYVRARCTATDANPASSDIWLTSNTN
jgi:hypothetical protein